MKKSMEAIRLAEMLLSFHSPLALLEILALVLGLMAETQLDQTMHKVPIINKPHPQYITM